MAFLILLAYLVSSTLAASCYFPDGSAASNYTACSADASDTSPSTCCASGYACLNSGVCEHTGAVGSGNGDTWVRGGCTDQSWKSSACPNFCLTGYESTSSGMEQCSSNTTDIYCCASDVNCDCGSGVGGVNFAGLPVALTTIGVTASATAEYITTTAVSGSSTSTYVVAVVTDPPSSAASAASSVSNATAASHATARSTAIAAGVSVPLGVILLAIISLLLYRYRRIKKKLSRMDQKWASPSPTSFAESSLKGSGDRTIRKGDSAGVYVTPDGYIRGYQTTGYPKRPRSNQYPYALPGQRQELDSRQKHEIDSKQVEPKHELETEGTELPAELESPVGPNLYYANSPQSLWSPESIDTLRTGQTTLRPADSMRTLRPEHSMRSLNAPQVPAEVKLKTEYSRDWQM
ncbi:MAG: hypothetical protein M1818_003780 [Claussenomyces sp. TS43310]|nr:MAG: hypothetical protein M1818_003780 [Claussenomyces sp. TS43310]